MIQMQRKSFKIFLQVLYIQIKFKIIAYEALSDPDKRRKYDQCGEECLNEPEGGGGMNPFGDMFGDIFGDFM